MLSDSIFYKPAEAKNIQKAIIMLHGYGSSGNDMISMAPYMAKGLPDTIFYAPNAPNEIMDGYKWFDLDEFAASSVYEQFDYLERLMKRARPVLPMIFDLIRAVSQKNKLNADEIFLMGFSQGGLMALMTGLLYKDKLAGIIGNSAVPIAINSTLTLEEVKNKPPVLLTHGYADDVVPYMGMQVSQNTLKNIGCKVETHSVNGMGHGIDETSIDKVIQFVLKN